jgi:hypothetical protein
MYREGVRLMSDNTVSVSLEFLQEVSQCATSGANADPAHQEEMLNHIRTIVDERIYYASITNELGI